MPVLGAAGTVYVGATPVTALYIGSNPIWSPASPITNGVQLPPGSGLTGYTAYYDTGLGRNLVLGDLTVTSGAVRASNFVSAGGTISKRHFTGDLLIDLPDITVRACLFDQPVSAYLNPDHYPRAFLDYCTVDSITVEAECMHYESWSANRCWFRGCSDGGKCEGGVAEQVLTECTIQVKMADGEDHNDGIQTVGGSGTVRLIRCWIDANPVGGLIPGGGGPDAAVLWSNYSSASVFHGQIKDCYLDGGGYVLALRDGGLTPNITFDVTGNRFGRNHLFGPIVRGSSESPSLTTPTSQIAWSGNVYDDNGTTIPLT